jgi:hypothetical protein
MLQFYAQLLYEANCALEQATPNTMAHPLYHDTLQLISSKSKFHLYADSFSSCALICNNDHQNWVPQGLSSRVTKLLTYDVPLVATTQGSDKHTLTACTWTSPEHWHTTVLPEWLTISQYEREGDQAKRYDLWQGCQNADFTIRKIYFGDQSREVRLLDCQFHNTRHAIRTNLINTSHTEFDPKPVKSC